MNLFDFLFGKRKVEYITKQEFAEFEKEVMSKLKETLDPIITAFQGVADRLVKVTAEVTKALEASGNVIPEDAKTGLATLASLGETINAGLKAIDDLNADEEPPVANG